MGNCSAFPRERSHRQPRTDPADLRTGSGDPAALAAHSDGCALRRYLQSGAYCYCGYNDRRIGNWASGLPSAWFGTD